MMKKNVKRILIYMIIGYIIGFCIGFLDIKQLVLEGFDFEKIESSIIEFGPIILILVISTLLLIGIIIVSISKKMLKNIKEEDIINVEKKLDIVGILSNLGLILSIVLLGLSISNVEKNSILIKTDILVSCAMMFIIIGSILQFVTVKVIKSINPEKQGNVLDKNFQKEWYNSCDEMQRKMIGEASYKTVQFMNKTLIILLFVIIVLTMLFNINISILLIVSAITILHTMIYSIYGIKIEYKNQKRR